MRLGIVVKETLDNYGNCNYTCYSYGGEQPILDGGARADDAGAVARREFEIRLPGEKRQYQSGSDQTPVGPVVTRESRDLANWCERRDTTFAMPVGDQFVGSL